MIVFGSLWIVYVVLHGSLVPRFNYSQMIDHNTAKCWQVLSFHRISAYHVGVFKKITATPQDGILFTATPYKANKRHRNTDNTANSHVSCCIGVAFLVTIPIYLIIRHIKGVDPKTPVLKSGSIFYCSLVIKYIE